MAIELRGLYNHGDAARMLNVTRRTILRWLKSGRITPVLVARQKLIPESEIERLRKERGGNADT